MKTFISKFFVYLPITLLRRELVFYYLWKYHKNQWLEKEILKEMQISSLKKIIKFACKNSQFYKGKIEYRKLIKLNGKEFFDEFEKIDFLTKQDIVQFSKEIATKKCLFPSKKTTGGSTGEPVIILKNASALARERAATWRSYQWASVGIGDKQARFWGVPHNSIDRLISRFIDIISNRRRFSAFNLDSKSIPKIYTGILKYQPKYIYGYVSSIRELANYIASNKLPTNKSLKSIITTSEVLTVNDRRMIEEVFGVKVFNEYGCGEVGSIAHECEYGQMHLMSDNLFVETTKDGEIVVTDLHNYAMPLIRYRLGDFIEVKGDSCKCGRSLPTISGISGRAYDLIVTKEGRTIHPESAMYIFEAAQTKTRAFKQFQLIQYSISEFEIKIVVTRYWDEKVKAYILNEFKENISPSSNIKFSLVEYIEREPSGKMRVVKGLLGGANSD